MVGSGRPIGTNSLVVASHNQGKIREFAIMLKPLGIDLVPASELGLSEPVEDGATFFANARIKALAASTGAGRAAVADDSGLVVAALGGAPGVHSARWAGPDKDFSIAMRRVQNELSAVGANSAQLRTANFTTALVLAWPDGHTEEFEGRIYGTLVWPPRGDRGFGYDPMFVAEGHTQTFGEMEPAEKHTISHRSEAFRQLADACFHA